MTHSVYAKTAVASSIIGNNETQRKKQSYTPPKARLVCVELNPGPRSRRGGRRARGSRRRDGVGNAWNQAQGLIRSPATLFPAAIQVRQTYTDSRDLTLTSGVFASYIYRMNSTFDPDFSGVGGQPYGRDQIAAIYTKYRVDGFRWNVSMSPASVGLGLCTSVAVCPAATSTAYTIIQDMANMPWGHAGVAPGTAPPFRAVGGFQLREFLGQSHEQFVGDDSNEAPIGSNATTAAFFHIGAQNNQGTTQVCTFVVTLTYITTYFLPAVMPPS